jgi:predicted ATPase/class 3 adenylate cyclase
MGELPSGTVTFLLTDIEGSTRLWETHGVEMAQALARHDEIIAGAVGRTDGRLLKTRGEGDSTFSVFARATDAIDAAVAFQHALATEAWPGHLDLRVRVAVHTGEAELRDGDYFGSAVSRAARLRALAHGGQVLVSNVTAAVGRSGLPPEVRLIDLGDHQLRDLAEPMRVFQLVHPELGADFPPLRSLSSLRGNLPRQVTSFVGRGRELKLIAELVQERPLVTLTGVGGVGKTRLGVQVAAEVMPDFPDGAWLCELAPVSDPGAVWQTLASSLGVLPSTGRPLQEVVLEYLGSKRLLIVLDNCEHLLNSVGVVVETIGRRCRQVVVLATSREGLAVAGEQIIAVPALGVPKVDADRESRAQSDAVQLFGDRARDASHDFVLGDANLAAIAQLCRRLDGIPLAIELAAARVRSLPPDELVARLDQRFRLLTRGSRASLERHQTLRNTIDWSYQLLSGAERTTLDRVSVFAGGWDLEAAEAVVAGYDLDKTDVVDLLGQLVDKSLVDVDPVDGPLRYRLLETIRQYAQERLETSGESGTTRGRHLDYYVTVSERAGPRLRGRDQVDCSADIARDIDNFRAALDFAVEASLPQEGLRLIVPLMVTGIPIGWTANDWAGTAASIDGAERNPLYPAALAYSSLGTTLSGDLNRAAELIAAAETAQKALATNHSWVHAASGTLALFQGNQDRAKQHAEIWLEFARSSCDPYEIAQALILLAAVLTGSDPGRAVVVAEEAVQVSRDAAIPGTLLYALIVRANPVLPSGDPAGAVALLDEAVEVASKLGDHASVASALMVRATTAMFYEDWSVALRASSRAARHDLQIGQLHPFGGILRVATVALAAMKAFEPAALLIGFIDSRFPTTPGGAGGPLSPGTPLARPQFAAAKDATRDALGAGPYEQRTADGARLSSADAVAILVTAADSAVG